MPATRTSSSNRRNRIAVTQSPSSSLSRPPRDVKPSILDPPLIKSDASPASASALAPATPAAKPTTPAIPAAKRSPRKRSPKWKEQGRAPRPPNAFIIFKSNLKLNPQHKDDYQNRLGIGENIGCLAASVWHNLDREEKAYWFRESEKVAAEHAEMYPDYKYQPQKKKKASPKKRKRSPSPDDDDDDDDDDDEDFSEDFSQKDNDDEESGGEEEEPSNSPVTVSSPSRSDQCHEPKQRRFVDVYTGAENNLDALYACGWKWALIKEIDESVIENPIVDSQESNPVLNVTPQDGDESASMLPIDLISMASVMNEAHAGLDTTALAQIEDAMDPSLQLFDHWDPSAAPSSAFFYDAPPSQNHGHGLHPYAESS